MKIKLRTEVIRNYISSPQYRFQINNYLGLYNKVSDRSLLEKAFTNYLGKKLPIEHPTSFNSKIQWLKLYDRKPIYTIMVDKYLVKPYVAGIIGEEYIIPTIGVWDRAEDIDFDTLPDKFVLKCNHNSGTGMYICRDKHELTGEDIRSIREGLSKGLKENFYLLHRELPYKDVQRKIIAEHFIETPTGDLPDYKLHCFNGKVRLILVCKNRFGEGGMTEDFFDEHWNHLEVHRPNMKFSSEEIEKPDKLDEMLSLAEKLSKDIPFVRVDFYCVNGKIYFGELTFFPASGFAPFEPAGWDEKLGSWLQLPEKVTE